MKNILIFLAATLLGGFFMPTQAQSPPPDMTSLRVQILIHCVDGLSRMAEVLADDFGEVPVVASELKSNTHFILFANESRTTSTLVIHRTSKDKDSACIIWTGSSPGASFAIAPDPEYPKPQPKGTNL